MRRRAVAPGTPIRSSAPETTDTVESSETPKKKVPRHVPAQRRGGCGVGDCVNGIIWWVGLLVITLRVVNYAVPRKTQAVPLELLANAITGKDLPDPPGVVLRDLGLRAKHPVVFVPGVVTGGLELWEGHECASDLFRERIWGGSFANILKSPKCWLKHMMLDNETGLDPPGIRVRAISGLVAADYFTPGYYVWAVLIENLAQLGYDESNLHMTTYDWRLSFRNTELRDHSLTRLKSTVETLLATNGGHKAVVLPHSMGSLYFLYFLKWVEAPKPLGGGGGPRWVADHIHAVLNIGPPFLGVPKAVTALLSGEMKDTAELRAMAPILDTLPFGRFTMPYVLSLLRSWDSIGSMLPKGGEAVWGGVDWSPEEGYDGCTRRSNGKGSCSAADAAGNRSRPMGSANCSVERTVGSSVDRRVGASGETTVGSSVATSAGSKTADRPASSSSVGRQAGSSKAGLVNGGPTGIETLSSEVGEDGGQANGGNQKGVCEERPEGGHGGGKATWTGRSGHEVVEECPAGASACEGKGNCQGCGRRRVSVKGAGEEEAGWVVEGESAVGVHGQPVAHYGRLISFGKEAAAMEAKAIKDRNPLAGLHRGPPVNISCGGDVYTEYQGLSYKAVQAVALRGIYTVSEAIQLLREVAPRLMARLDSHWSLGLAADLSDPKYHGPHRDRFWANPLETSLPDAPDTLYACLYGVGKLTERSYIYDLAHHNDSCYIPFHIDAAAHGDSEGCLKGGVQLVDGDGTVPTLSNGFQCAKGWRGKSRFNPSGSKVLIREYEHVPPVPLLEGRGVASGNHVDIMGNFALISDILKVVSGVGLGGDVVYSKIMEWAKKINLD